MLRTWQKMGLEASHFMDRQPDQRVRRMVLTGGVLALDLAFVGIICLHIAHALIPHR